MEAYFPHTFPVPYMTYSVWWDVKPYSVYLSGCGNAKMMETLVTVVGKLFHHETQP